MKRKYDILFDQTVCNYLVIDGIFHKCISHVEMEKLQSNDLSDISLSNKINDYFEYFLEVEIEGLRTKFHSSKFFENQIYIFPSNCDIEINKKMRNLFGNTQLLLELMDTPGSPIISGYVVSTSSISKVIGIKRFRDATTIGQRDGVSFTGKIEETVLDLENFDEDIYKRIKQYINFEIRVHQLGYFETHSIQKELIYPSDEEIEENKKAGVFYGPWWSTWKENSKYMFDFIAARQGGESITIEISKEDHEALINSIIDVNDISRKYNL